VDEEKIPHHPPFLAYVSNLPYDLDEDDLVMFFKDMKVCWMFLIQDETIIVIITISDCGS
jgi:translation initiation factor 4B